MLHGVSGIRVVGLVFLLLSLFEPLTLATTVAEGAPPPPDETLLEGTPGSDPAPEPTVEILPTESAPEPTQEPTLPPEPTAEPTIQPTIEPTAVPTAEPTVAPTPEPTIAPTENPAIEEGDDADVQTASEPKLNQPGQLEISIQPDAPAILSSEAIGFTITLTNTGETTITYINLHGAGVPTSWSMREFTGNDESCGIGPTSGIGLWCIFNESREAMPLEPGSSLIVSFAGAAEDCSPFSISPYAYWNDTEGDGGRPEVTASVDVECVPEIGIDLSGTTETWHNQFVAYEITVSNTGMAASGEVRFDGTLPGPTGNWSTGERTGMSECDLTPDGEGNTALSCVTNPIPIGGEATAQFSTTFSPSPELCDTTYFAQVTLVTGGTGSDQVSFPATCPSGYLSLDIDQGDSNVLRGQMMDITFRLTNIGYTGIHDAYLWVGNLPDTWTIQESPGSPWCSLTGGFLICEASTDNAESFPLGYQDAFEVSISGLATTCGGWSIPIETFSHAVEGSETLFFHVHCPSPAPGIQVTTSVDPAAGLIGDDITFTYDVTNTGNTPLTNVTVTDPLVGEVADCARELLPALAAPYSCTMTYTIDAANIVDGQVASEAAASAFHAEAEVSGTAETTVVDVLPDPGLSVTIEPDATEVNAGDDIGATITFFFTDPEAIYGLYVEFPEAPGLEWSGEHTECVKSEECRIRFDGETQLSISGSSPTTAESCGTHEVNAGIDFPVELAAEPATITVLCPEPEPDVEITKVAEPETVSAGEPIGYAITLSNIGDAAATNVGFTDPLPEIPDQQWALADEAPEGCAIAESGVLTCEGIDLPAKTGEAIIRVTSPTSTEGTTCGEFTSVATLAAPYAGSGTATVTVLCPPVTISVEPVNADVTAGEDISFRVTLTTDENRFVNWSMNLPRADGLSWSSSNTLTCWFPEGTPATLNCTPHLYVEFPFVVTVTSPTTDASCGVYDVVAEVTSPSSVAISSDPATVTIHCPEPEPGISINTAAEPTAGRIGDDVTFTYEITNTGNVPLTSIGVTDSLLGGVVDCNIATLPANGESDHITTCSGTYTIDADDVADGQITSSATVNAMFDETNVSSASGDVIIDVLPELEPAVTISKVADEAQMPYGGVPGFTITVTNEGDAPATGVAFEDYLPYRGGLPWELRSQFNHCVLDLNNDELLECSGIDLEPGDDFEVRVSAFYGYSAMCDTTLESTAQLTQGGEGEATASIYVVCPGLTITVLPDSDGVIAGNDLGVTIQISNASSFEADPVTILGQLPAASGLEWSTSDPVCYIAPTAELDCYHLTIPANGSRDIRLTSPTTNASCGEHDLSAEIDHPYLIDATHSATITVLCPEPELPEITQAACVDGEFTAPDIELAETNHITYTLDPASGWAAGDTVTVTATLDDDYGWPLELPEGWSPVPDVPNQVTAAIELEIPDCPSMEISRSIEPTFARLGDEVTLSYEITNTGNVPLEEVYVSDYLLGTVPACSLDAFPPEGDGEHTHRCTATTTVVEQPGREGIFQSDWASVWGNHDGEWLTASAGSVSVTIEQDNPVTIAADAETVTAGEEIGFTITVGDSISRIFIYNHLNSAGHIYDWTITADDPSSCWSWADGYPVWQPFNCEWEETSTPRAVTVHATAPTTIESCGTVELDSMVLVDHVQHDLDPVTVTVLCPEVSVDLSSEPAAGTEVREGDEITYTLTLINTGEVPLTNVAVDTDITGLADDPISDLEVDGSVTRSGTYTVAPGDVAAEQITRSANATGDASTGVGTAPTDPVTLTHPVTQSPSIGLDIDADLQAPSDEHPLGALDYTLSVTNTGDSTLTDIAITAPLLNEEPIPVADLGPGRDATIEATYTLTQADIDAGHITTEASVGGMPPTGPSGVRDYANITVDLPQETGLAVDMSTDADEVAEGDELTVTFTVINTGTVTIREITITTTLADLVWETNDTAQTSILTFAQAQKDGVVGDLGPGETRTRTATYTVTGDDVDRGEIVIGATVTGIGVDGEITVTAEPVAITVVQPAPDPDPTPEPTPEPTVPPTPEPTIPPTVDPDPTVPPTGDPEATATAPTTPHPGAVPTPTADGTAINVSSLPSTGAGASGGAMAGMIALLVAALLAGGGVLVHRQRR